VLTVLSTVVVLSVLILVHELGHFFAAKAVGIQVPRFSLGFGKKLWGFRIGETEFVLSAIPLGGYVKMAGMEDDEAAEALEGAGPADEVDPERTFDSKSLWARTLVISAGVIMNLLFAWLVFTVLAYAWGSQRVVETRVSVAGNLAAPTNPRLAGIREGARLTAVGGRPVSDWDDVVTALSDAPSPVELRFADQPAVTVELPGSTSARAEALAGFDAYRPAVIERVEAGTPAKRAGLQPGDRVTAAAGVPVHSWQQLVRAIQSHPGKPLPLTVQRGAQTVQLTVTPNAAKETDLNGRRITVGKVGAASGGPAVESEPVGLGEAVVKGGQATWGTAAFVGDILRRLVTGQISARNMGGLLSIGEASGETARLGLQAWLIFLASFSVNLAVLNLLPIPILDGGHLMFLAFEAVRGRPLSVEARIRLSQVGLVIVVALMLWANGNDVVRILFNR
jgi:regulator of sigma E protease